MYNRPFCAVVDREMERYFLANFFCGYLAVIKRVVSRENCLLNVPRSSLVISVDTPMLFITLFTLVSMKIPTVLAV